MKIPYGMSNFADLRRSGYFYADKTGFLPVLESEELGNRYLLFLRPRRYGKSLLISMLEHYYDRGHEQSFDELFGGLAIHQAPTPLRNSYLVLTLDFSNIDTTSERLFSSFLSSLRSSVRVFLTRHKARVPAYGPLLDRLDSFPDPSSLMTELFDRTLSSDQRIYILVDEYDNFSNELIVRRKTDLYHEIIEGSGFVRTFYKTIKGATRSGAVARLLMTGVLPITLDDLSSGFNITAQVTLDERCNALCGFTSAEVEQAVDAFRAVTPGLAEREALLSDLQRYYNGYLFSRQARERMFNPDMVLYFLMELRRQHGYPQELLDVNVRTDYGKLQRLASPPGGPEQWHKELLETLLSEGRVVAPVVDRFPARKMYERHHLVSILYFMGLVTIGGQVRGQPCLEVPNHVVRTLHLEEMARLLRERAGVVLDTDVLATAISRMAYDGEIEPFLALIQERVMQVLSNRDLMNFDEKHIKMVLLSYLSLSPIYRPLSEKEMKQGYSDLLLALDQRFPDARYAYLIELKHLRTGATEEEIAAKRAEGERQVERYLRDEGLLPALMGNRTIKAVVLCFLGAQAHRLWEVGTG